MPRAEEDNSPRGLPPGAEQQLTEEGKVAPDQSPAAAFAGAVPLESTVNQPAPQKPAEKFVPPQEDQVPPNILPNGMNLDEIIHGPTARPTENVLQGLDGPGLKVSDMLEGIAKQYPSPDVQALLNAAKAHGL